MYYRERKSSAVLGIGQSIFTNKMHSLMKFIEICDIKVNIKYKKLFLVDLDMPSVTSPRN